MALYADAAVVELLDSSNYKDWSALVKTYLLAQDLWDVVEEEEEYDDEEEEEEEAEDEFKAWRKKNAMALHKIQISCGREAFSLIRNTTSAKRAWDTLAEEFKPKPDAAVVELLDSSNYVDWSVWVKTYLLAQDLWDVVEKEEEYDDEEEEEEEADDNFKAWREKNAAALHKIQISCGREASSLLRNTSSAKRAWDTLAEEFNPKPDAAVVELLDSSNYVDWSVWVKTYLLDQDLWDVVEKEEEYDDDDDEEEADDKFKAWREKNATALHKIQISCGREASSRIRNTSSAKHAWDTLAGYYNYNQNKPLFDAVLSGDWNEAEKFLTLHPDAIRARLPSTNDTALHKAIELENEHIVEGLVQLMSEEDLKLKENEGWTALALAAQRGNIEMVECMVRKNEKILSIPNEEDNMTPILHASLNENWDVVNYLYSVTPLQDLMPGKGPYGAGLLYNFILGMKFGSALELIERCPQLVFTQDIDGQFPMEGFVPSAFPSGTRFKFWQRWIYNCIHIERAISDIRVSVQNERNEECNRWKITWSSVVRFLQGLKSNLLELLGKLQFFFLLSFVLH
ncbi:hypothetical protein ACE6H2_006852 [Prunus campanulata]